MWKCGLCMWKCGLCMVSPGSEPPKGSREEIVDHLEDHGVLDIDRYLTNAGEQTTLDNL